MKNRKHFIVMAIATIIALALTSCGGDAPEPLPPPPTSAIFESSDTAGNIYILAITEAASGNIRAAYTPKGGDSYILTFISTVGNVFKSIGKVKTAGSTLTLTPIKDGTPATPFTVTTSGETMTAITVESGETITVTEGTGTITTPASLTPKVPETYPALKLLANPWGKEGEGNGENWVNATDFKYSKFTKVIPKPGDRITFQIRGTTDKPLNWFSIAINSHRVEGDQWLDYIWHGGSEQYKIPISFNETIETYIYADDSYDFSGVYENLYLEFANSLWQKDEDGKYTHNSGLKLNVPFGTVMATISNLEVRLVGIER